VPNNSQGTPHLPGGRPPREWTRREARGTVRTPCPTCGEHIRQNMVTCTACGYEHRFDQEQYDVLHECWLSGDPTDWTVLRDSDLSRPVHLEAANLRGARLAGVNLAEAHMERADLGGADLTDAYLIGAHLQRARLVGARLDGADLEQAWLTEARLIGASLDGASLMYAHLQKALVRPRCAQRAEFDEACLDEARLHGGDLRGARFTHNRMQGAVLNDADLRGTVFIECDLRGAEARFASVDGMTLLRDCTVSRATDFTGTGLEAARVDPVLMSRLQRNVREIAWGKWYKGSRSRMWLWGWVVRVFWWVSDYGSSTLRIVASFAVASLAFAILYAAAPSLLGGQGAGELGRAMRFARALYFSVVTMTTLGFGDLHANEALVGLSLLASYAVLVAHVLIGYVLLGALITRFAIMFQGTTAPDPSAVARAPHPWRTARRRLRRHRVHVLRTFRRLRPRARVLARRYLGRLAERLRLDE
jgi:uncharacterized protein YjbI with pentapeptide repeats